MKEDILDYTLDFILFMVMVTSLATWAIFVAIKAERRRK